MKREIYTEAPIILDAARCVPVAHTPVWFMRQAGRVLPEYRRVREKHDLLSICRQPDLCTEVTLQPVRRLDVDAAIIFSDIVLPLVGVGVDLEIVENTGPVVRSPVRSMEDVLKMRPLEPEEDLPYLLEALRLVRGALPAGKALIGFAGAPFTLATYLIEGGPSRNYLGTKSMMYQHPSMWHALMERLSDMVTVYLKAQINGGAQIVQLFDSWVGWLSPRDYLEYVFPYTKRILQSLRGLDAPLVHFGTGTGGLLVHMKDAGADVVGLDWRVRLDQTWSQLGYETAVQGNLDPAVLLGPLDTIRVQAEDILRQAEGRPGHIFSLGHGLLPETPLDNILRLVEFVREWSSLQASENAKPTQTREEIGEVGRQ